ncbi:MAG TPA: ThiF family adenylyltransferase [Solirubrobacterales bacterium]|nr:ThiF family adenylyltransferase [Solirubrobacterales bacterium]
MTFQVHSAMKDLSPHRRRYQELKSNPSGRLALSGDDQTWWELDPERFELELTYLAEIGPVERLPDEEERLVLKLEVEPDGSLPLTVRFPRAYPFLPPDVSGPIGTTERHQNPFSGRFCITDDQPHWWTPDKRAALVVQEVLSLIAASEAGNVADREAAMPEPITGYLLAGDKTAVVFDAMLEQSLASTEGTFDVLPLSPNAFTVDGIDGICAEPLRTPNRVCTAFGVARSNRQRGRHTWRALDEPPRPRDLVELCANAFEELKLRSQPHQQRSGRGRRNKTGLQLWTARTFLEEGPRRGEQRRAWVFFLAILKKDGSIDEEHIVSSQAFSKSARDLRVPELTALSDCWALVVGAGALGAPAVGELAKAGVGHIDVVDPDRFDLNNSVRHVLSVSAAGEFKASAVAAWAKSRNPYSEVRGHCLAVGDDDNEIRDLVDAADVVIDATGLHHVTRLLHRQCANSDVPLVSAGLSLGGYGGRVVILRDPKPCIDCFLADESIPRPEEENPKEGVTPYGCSHPAASCAGFDAMELASNVARAAVRATSITRYPSLDFDWAVVNFRPSGKRWEQGLLEPFDQCPWCAK